jgi:hypothetical protein
MGYGSSGKDGIAVLAGGAGLAQAKSQILNQLRKMARTLLPYQRGQPPPIVTRSIEEQSEENGGMNGSEGSCSRRGWDSFEDFGQRPADVAENRFGTKDDSPANVQLGEEGRKRMAI